MNRVKLRACIKNQETIKECIELTKAKEFSYTNIFIKL